MNLGETGLAEMGVAMIHSVCINIQRIRHSVIKHILVC